MDGLFGGITGFCIHNFPKEFTEFEVCIEEFRGYGEEGTAFFTRASGGVWLGERVLFTISEGDVLNCLIYFIEK
jgi:hypothetical protein